MEKLIGNISGAKANRLSRPSAFLRLNMADMTDVTDMTDMRDVTDEADVILKGIKRWEQWR